MSTDKQTISFILDTLHHSPRISARAMFGEYALYADGKVVALICDDTLYVKILPASQALEKICEKGSPYPGAKLHYVLSEEQTTSLSELSSILFAIAKSLPEKKKKASKVVKK